MSGKVATAVLALQDYIHCKTLIEVYSTFAREHQGKIVKINKLKLTKGVSESIFFKFPDLSILKLTRFITKEGRVHISIKRED